MKQLIAPSLLAADFMNLQRDVEMINQSEADFSCSERIEEDLPETDGCTSDDR